MSDRLLSDEGINQAREPHIGTPLKCWPQHRAIAEAQCALTERRERTEIAEWLEGCCPHSDRATEPRWDCAVCMAELLDALGEGKAPTPSGQWPEGE